jgi:hypothetical protein
MAKMSKKISKKDKFNYEQKQQDIDNLNNIASDSNVDNTNSISNSVRGSVSDSDLQTNTTTETEEQEDVYKLFLFYPNGIDKTKQEDVYKLTDAELDLHIECSDDKESIKSICGKLKTSYFFPDTNIGDMRTWRFRFYDVVIKRIHIDASSDFIYYDIEAGGFDVNNA